jgi:hypothetical protein
VRRSESVQKDHVHTLQQQLPGSCVALVRGVCRCSCCLCRAYSRHCCRSLQQNACTCQDAAQQQLYFFPVHCLQFMPGQQQLLQLQPLTTPRLQARQLSLCRNHNSPGIPLLQNHAFPAACWRCAVSCIFLQAATPTLPQSQLCPNQMFADRHSTYAPFFPSAGGYTDPAACLVPLGHFFNGQAAVPCPKGQWNDRAPPNTDSCKFCPAGLTTFGSATGATSQANCSWVLPGYGYSAALVPFRCPRGEAEGCRL